MPKSGGGQSQSQNQAVAALQAKFMQGMALYQQGRLAEAERIFGEVLQQKPNHFDTLHLLGIIALQTRRTERGVDLIKKAIGLNAKVADAHYNLGNALLIDLNRPKEALASYDKAIALKSDLAEAYGNRGIALRSLKHPAEALKSYEKAIALKPDYVEAYSNSGNALLDLRRPAEALTRFDKAIALKPDYVEAYSNSGNALLDLRRPAEALTRFDKAIALKPDYVEAYSNRGIALKDLKRPTEALASYDKAIALKADITEAWLGRGNVLRELKRYDEALAAYDKAASWKPGLAEAWLGRGNIFYDLKRYDEALAAYDKALSTKPDLEGAWLGRGNVFYGLKRYDEAFAAYNKTLALNLDLAEAWHGRGNVLYALRRYDEALVSYDKALALKPNLANAWLNRGEALVELKRVQESIAAFRQALKFGGDSELTKYNLAALGAEPPPSASPERYIVDLFDSYAFNFDRELVDNLNYQIPTLLVNTIKRFVSSNTLDILDLGCGTGLVGECIRPFVRTLTGIDLSTKMLQKARQREIYDHLVCSELTKFLQTQDRRFDLVVAADVFIYIGDLSVVFREVRRALRDSGLFCFSVEATDESDFVLSNTRRYAHSIGCLEKLAEQYGFAIDIIEPQIIRREAGADVNGYLAILRCL